jgi:endoglucanase
MLVAAARGDGDRFAQVWTWTRDHLRREDGSLAWRWADGRVADPEPAADADLDAARALLVAAERFDEPGYAVEGRALGRAAAENMTADEVLTAGPWARGEGVVNPSYWSPRALAMLGLDDLAASAQRLTARLTESGLPPDWARVEPWGVAPAGSPDGGGPAVYSYDAVRVPLRLAESCDPADREIAARMWTRLRARPGVVPRALDGTPMGDGEHAAALVGAAAAARAAGDFAAAGSLLERAEAVDRARPSYYGGAMVALGWVVLRGAGGLGECP